MKRILKYYNTRFVMFCIFTSILIFCIIVFFAKVQPIGRPQTCDSCFNQTFNFLINNENICKPTNVTVEILVLITSSPQNRLARQVLRETWLTYSKNNTAEIRYAFLIGQSKESPEIFKESILTNDIILGDFIEVYYNLTLKTMMGLQWAVKYCKHTKFVMKSDDDVYLNVPGLVRAVKDNSIRLQTAVAGYCESGREPVRDNTTEWFASFRQYPEKTYPRYCLGGPGYVTSMNVVSQIVNISKNVPYFYIEDIYIALCTTQLRPKVYHLKLPGFYAIIDKFHPCIFKNESFVAGHYIRTKTIRYLWNTPCTQ